MWNWCGKHFSRPETRLHNGSCKGLSGDSNRDEKARKFFTGNDLGSISKETVSIPETEVTPETSHKNCRERNLEGKRCHETSSVKQDWCSVSFRWLFSDVPFSFENPAELFFKKVAEWALTSDQWDMPWLATRERCITILYRHIKCSG